MQDYNLHGVCLVSTPPPPQVLYSLPDCEIAGSTPKRGHPYTTSNL